VIVARTSRMDNPSNHEQWHTASSDTYFFADAYQPIAARSTAKTKPIRASRNGATASRMAKCDVTPRGFARR
jgi:hypothetical protein